MSTELGSEYDLRLSELSVKENNIFGYLSGAVKAYFFDSGRSALRHITRSLGHGCKVLLPEFICGSVIECFKENDIDFYRLNDDFTADINDLRRKAVCGTKAIFFMHYFGAVQPEETLKELRCISESCGSVLIEDTTHSIFSERRTVGDVCICSIRKWLPIPGGGALYHSGSTLVPELPEYPKSVENDRAYGMMLKHMFLNHGYSCNPEYRRIFAECERRLDSQKNISMLSDLSRFIASCTDIGELTRRRRSNYDLLGWLLAVRGITPAVKLAALDIPLSFPIRVPERDRLRAYLSEHRIYCAVHWPFDGSMPEKRPNAVKNADSLISLPIDQRYGAEEIRYLANVLLDYRGELKYLG